MLPTQERCADLGELVEQEMYFVIHAPRQVGKTTLIRDFVQQLNQQGDYLAIYCSLERAQGFSDPREGVAAILNALEWSIEISSFAETKSVDKSAIDHPDSAVLKALSGYCSAVDKPVVVMFDEVDCLSEQTLVTFLRQLRNGFIDRGLKPFVSALGLVGMRNIRDYKVMLREGRETLGGASPFNIVTKALTIRNFTEYELSQLYAQHGAATGQHFSTEVVGRIFHYTNGQPWLCNAIAREIVHEILENDHNRSVTVELVEQAVERIILRRDTHIDSLLERLREPRVRRIVEPVLLGKRTHLDLANDDARYVFDLGLMIFAKGDVQPANRIYGEVIIRWLTFNSQYHLDDSWENRFIDGDRVDMSTLMKAFQAFWRENSDIWVEKYEYKEAAPQLIIQAFLQRVINGGGRIDREYSAGRGRIDLCVTMGENRYPIELKIRYGQDTREKGLDQLSEYMQTLGCDEGWLVIFDRDPEKDWADKLSWDDVNTGSGLIHIVGV